MIRWTPYIFLRLVFFLVLGITFQEIITFDFDIVLYLFITTGALYGLIGYYLPGFLRVKFEGYIGFWACILIFLFGWLRAFTYQAANDPKHFMHQENIQAYVATLSSPSQAKAKSIRFEANVYQIKTKGLWQESTGKVILYFQQDSLHQSLKQFSYGDKILIAHKPKLVKAPQNPGMFNYQAYLKTQNILHQHYIRAGTYTKIQDFQGFDVFSLSFQLRELLSAHLIKHINDPQVLGVASALLLGSKEYLDDEVRSSYAGTGLMHILAVSGLHVAFIMGLLDVLLKRLKKYKYGSYLRLVLMVVGLWAYAFLTGLSPSVMRAVTMLCFAQTSEIFRRKKLIYNTLGASAFLLLAINPLLVFSVSFQLSYIAVLGIVYFQPKIYRIFEFNNRFLNYFWGLTSVSLAAQLATFPLGLYYFHQFPNYFLISNILVLPLVQLMLYVGIAFLFTCFIPSLSFFVGFVFEKMIFLANWVTFVLNKLPFAITEGIFLQKIELFLIYAILLSLILLFTQRKFKYLMLATALVLVFSGLRIQRVYHQKTQEYLVIYDTPKSSGIGLIDRQESVLLADSTLLNSPKTLSFHVQPFLDSLGIHARKTLALQSKNLQKGQFAYKNMDAYAVLIWKNLCFLIIQKKITEKNLEKLKPIKPDFVIIRQKAIRKLQKLSQIIPAQKYIIDSSNGYYRSQSLENEADSLSIPSHVTLVDGAFVIPNLH